MILLVLAGLIVLAAGGCVCVVWASRGGPTWVRAVATATLAAGELVRRSGSPKRGSSQSDGGDS